MLVGGRPLPQRPLWVRALTVIVIVAAGIPLAQLAYEWRAPLGLGPRKLSAEETARLLPARLYFPNAARGDLRCEDHARTPDAADGRTGAWDFICTFAPDPNATHRRLKVGVRVGPERITDVSSPHELDAKYVKW